MADEKEKEGSGFAVDDLIDETSLDESEMDDWEKKERMKREKAARLMAKAILAGSLDEEGVVKSIMDFYDTAMLMRSI